MIKKVEVLGLNGKLDFVYDFNSDLNILTGKNGAGKTTLLKLLWYMMSSNRELILSEIRFNYVHLVTDEYEFTIDNRKQMQNGILNKVSFEYLEKGQYNMSRVFTHDHGILLDDDREFINELNRRADVNGEETIFFPTFRRIEGGFALEGRRRMYGHPAVRTLSDGLEEYSMAMSSRRHKFVASISTSDIEELLTRKYADISEKTNSMYLDFSQFIMKSLEGETGKNASGDAAAVKFRDDIKKRLSQVTENREKLMRPFDTLAALIKRVFKDKGISVSSALTFGMTKAAIRARILSAGEKQMFSFLSYNAFAKQSVIFIDEPELSLHVDWQRILFKMMLEQGSSNQFIITTHSPSIYAAYPEKELALIDDRGV